MTDIPVLFTNITYVQAMGVLFANKHLVKDAPSTYTTVKPTLNPDDLDPSVEGCSEPTDPMRRWLLLHGRDTVKAYDRLVNHSEHPYGPIQVSSPPSPHSPPPTLSVLGALHNYNIT